jgi:hypothetical protein
MCSFQRFAIFKIPILGDTKPVIVLNTKTTKNSLPQNIEPKKIVVIKVAPIQVYKEGVKQFLQINETIFCITYNMGTLRISTFKAIT